MKQCIYIGFLFRNERSRVQDPQDNQKRHHVVSEWVIPFECLWSFAW